MRGSPDSSPAPGAEPAQTVDRGWTRWLAAVAYMAFLYLLSSVSTLPRLPGDPSDKLEHLGAFWILGLLLTWAVSKGRFARLNLLTVLGVTALCAIYGYTDELHQRFVPGRDYEVMDMAADAAGGAIASAMLWAWGILSRGRRRADER